MKKFKFRKQCLNFTGAVVSTFWLTVDLILTPTELNAGENDFFVQNALKNWLETNKEEPCTTCETELTEEEIIELKDDDENF